MHAIEERQLTRPSRRPTKSYAFCGRLTSNVRPLHSCLHRPPPNHSRSSRKRLACARSGCGGLVLAHVLSVLAPLLKGRARSCVSVVRMVCSAQKRAAFVLWHGWFRPQTIVHWGEGMARGCGLTRRSSRPTKSCAFCGRLMSNVRGAADKAADLERCESSLRQLPGFGRIACPLRGEVTNHDRRGCKSHGC